MCCCQEPKNLKTLDSPAKVVHTNMEWAATEPGALKAMPFVLARTLGREWGSANLAALWSMLMTAPKHLRKNAARAGFEPGIDQGERLFQAVVDTNMKTLMRNPEWNRNKRAGTIALSPEDAEVIFSSSPRRRLCRNDKMDSFSSCHAGPRSGIQWCNTKKTTGFRVKPGMT